MAQKINVKAWLNDEDMEQFGNDIFAIEKYVYGEDEDYGEDS
jgi:hypothetical protein